MKAFSILEAVLSTISIRFHATVKCDFAWPTLETAINLCQEPWSQYIINTPLLCRKRKCWSDGDEDEFCISVQMLIIKHDGRHAQAYNNSC